MKLTNLAGLALKHVRNAFAEELYIRTHRDITRPVVVYGMVNEWCNYKCRYCEYWRLPNYREEMTIEEWQKALLSLKEFVGPYHIEFSGGEPYIKKGFVDLIGFCHEHGINWGVTTNGSAFTDLNLGALTFTTGNLTVTGLAGKRLGFSSTTLANANFTLNDVPWAVAIVAFGKTSWWM